ncbi:Proton-coupled amino acid transporter 4 [Trichostrongylus colubriformis]|uniref:Proton-coupled amino acid transporter 4 n=1 Tax=Trichostrongylus colubriformis TaxID=6319 RepID=A0AAN8IKC2_TRICO
MATGAVIYSFEGQALILPLENKMKHPSEMRGWTGVLTTGITLVTTVYAGCGFFGYITYGENVKGSITLNMDHSGLNLGMKALLALVVYTGYLLQLYTLTTSLRPSVMRLIERTSSSDKRKMVRLADYGLRSGIVLVSFLLAVLVPNLENLIPLIGVTSGMLLALVIPPMADVATFLPIFLEEKRFSPIVMLISNNLFFCVLGMFFLVSGLEANLNHLL